MTARLRLLLAILLLALAPALAPVAGAVAVAPALAPPHGCLHSCDTPAGLDHAQAVCACATHLALAPLATVGQVPMLPLEPLPVPAAEDALSSAHWPPPLRPPRA